jgi:Ca2+-binding RTX toxin-like protein
MDGANGSDIYIMSTAAEHIAAGIDDNGTTGTDEVRFASITANDTLVLYAGDTGIERVVIGTGTSSTAVTTGTTALNVDASLVLNGLSITGNAGDNVLKGTAYNDTLTGGAGADAFVFNTHPNATTNHDTITDFQQGLDVLQLSKTIFTTIGSSIGGFLNANEFWSGAGITSGQDNDDRIIYDTTTGNLYYDADGSSSFAAVLIALIGTTTHPSITYTDILITA